MGIKFFRKNIYDITNALPITTVADAIATNTGEAFSDLMRNRSQASGWATTGSTDAALTTIVINLVDSRNIDRILLVGHNLKAYTIKYNSLGAWTDFSTPINETANALSTTYHSFTSVLTDKIQIVISGTIVANADKYIKQLILTEILGDFSIEPEMQPQFDKDRKVTKFLSGKSFVAKSVGAFNLRIKMKSASDATDLALVETLYNSYEGFLVWPSGGDTSGYSTNIRQGYRLEDIFLMDLVSEYTPEFVESRWANGLPIDLKLVEVS